MPKQKQCEDMIRYYCRDWLRSHPEQQQNADFYEFKKWMHANGRGEFFDFKCRAGAEYMAEWWFDQETNQTYKR